MASENPNTREPQIQNESSSLGFGHAAVIVLVFVFALGVNELIDAQAPKYFPVGAEDIKVAGAALTFVALFIAFFWRPLSETVRSRQHKAFVVASIESVRQIHLLNLVVAAVVALCFAFIALAQIDWKMKLFGLVAVGVIPGVVLQVRRIPIELAFRGSYDQALRIQQWIAMFPNCGSLMKGWILVEAGRYQEGRDVLRGAAFDAKNEPRPQSFHLELYTYSLAAEGALDTAIALYETCSQVHPAFENHKLGLASCLLVKGTESARARALIEEVFANCFFDRDADRVCAVGLHAFSLARNGYPEQARQRLVESFAIFDRCKGRDQGALWLEAGATYHALGERETARNAFREAIRIHPFGSNKLRAEAWLKRMDEATPAS